MRQQRRHRQWLVAELSESKTVSLSTSLGRAVIQLQDLRHPCLQSKRNSFDAQETHAVLDVMQRSQLTNWHCDDTRIGQASCLWWFMQMTNGSARKISKSSRAKMSEPTWSDREHSKRAKEPRSDSRRSPHQPAPADSQANAGRALGRVRRPR